MDRAMYCEKMDENHLLSATVLKICCGWVFQPDDDPKHTMGIKERPKKKIKVIAVKICGESCQVADKKPSRLRVFVKRSGQNPS